MPDGGWPWQWGVLKPPMDRTRSAGPLSRSSRARLCELLQSGSRVAVRVPGPSALAGSCARRWRSSFKSACGPLARARWKRTDACLRPCAAAQRSRSAPAINVARGAACGSWMASRIPHWRRASRTPAAIQSAPGRCRRGPGGRALPLARLAQPPLCIAGAGCLSPLPVGQREVLCPAAGSGW